MPPPGPRAPALTCARGRQLRPVQSLGVQPCGKRETEEAEMGTFG